MRKLNLEAFLGSRDSAAYGLASRPWASGFASKLSLPACTGTTNTRPAYLPASLHRTFPISYAFQPRLRGRLTPGRLPLPGKPWVYGERVFHPFYRYSCQHNHFSTVHRALRLRLQPVKNAPLPDRIRGIRSFGIMLIRPVSYYAFFKRWLLLSQRPGCLYNVTTLTTEHEFGDLSCRSGLLPFRRRTLAPAV